ncbi:MAG: hypothetical protein JRJ06_03370 [Deltaproteobacteria bacterium]|nr:hypothetical protein [Deltaproteobacteria bacterium]
MPSKALQINLETSRVDVTISDKYAILQEVMSRYQGIMEGLNIFLAELCHPYMNWPFIVREARKYSLDYYHLLSAHPKGPQAARVYMDIFLDAIDTAPDSDVKADAADNLLLFLQKIIRDSGKKFPVFIPALEYGFDRITGLEDENFFLFVKSFYQIDRLAKGFQDKASSEKNFHSINSLLARYLKEGLSFWLEEADPLAWFTKEVNPSAVRLRELQEIFRPILHDRLKAHRNALESALQKDRQSDRSLLDMLLLLPGYRQLVERYREIPGRLLKLKQGAGRGNYWKLIFLFHIMNTAGLSSIHEEALREINRTLTWLIANEKVQDLLQLIQKTFAILKVSVRRYPGTALNCVQNMGEAVYKTDESDMVDSFIDYVVDLGFQTPDLKGVGDDWQMRVNSAHIRNIRTWMKLIELNPKWSKKLLSSLIICLSLGGVFIRDTDLFPHDITDFLNSDIAPVYNLVKQLTRLFPAYFNDIGAEGHLRDISTEIDEICHRKDLLIHFLRKQSHVESSNQIVKLMEATLDFWRTRKKEVLKPLVPPNLYEQIKAEGPYVDGVHRLITHLFKKERLTETSDLLNIGKEAIRGAAQTASHVSDTDQARVEMAVSFYGLLYQKYDLGYLKIDSYLKQFQPGSFPDEANLRKA